MSTFSQIDPLLLNSEFVSQVVKTPLRVCCYGSSSSSTPEKYLKEAQSLGYILAKRGHTCVNGAGPYGCMAAMNDGADAGDGHIVGVIHEMFVLDNSDWLKREGIGAHRVFSGIVPGRTGAKRELLIAGGNDLQERKKLLQENADGLVVLPGGPGTWDELWEMACARNLGISNLPIVCISVDGYYDAFQSMLERAYTDKLLRLKPQDIVHYEPTAEKAIRWLEQIAKNTPNPNSNTIQKRETLLKRTSIMEPPSFSTLSNMIFQLSNRRSQGSSSYIWSFAGTVIGFTLGIAVGALLPKKVSSTR